MRLKVCVALFTLAAAATLYAADPPKQPAMTAEEKAEMEAMIKAATPGEAHKALQPMAGTFDTKLTMWPKPSAPPVESGGTTVNQWILGGRYLEQKFDGSFMGMPFSGIGYTGYDNVKKQYFSTWIDSMGTGMMVSSGAPAGPNRWKFTGSYADPVTGKDVAIEEKITVADNDHHTFEMWAPGPDGKSFKTMEIKYSRKK
jgi:hypothetical protein